MVQKGEECKKQTTSPQTHFSLSSDWSGLISAKNYLRSTNKNVQLIHTFSGLARGKRMLVEIQLQRGVEIQRWKSYLLKKVSRHTTANIFVILVGGPWS